MNSFHDLEAGYIYSHQIKPIISWLLNNTSLVFLYLIVLTISVIFLFFLRRLFALKMYVGQESVFLELTPPASTEKTAYTTQQLFSVIHSLGIQKSFFDKLLGRKILFSFEIVSTQNQGIRYLLRTRKQDVNNIKRTILSYLPGIEVKVANEYLPELKNNLVKVIEFQQSRHFAYPLQNQDLLSEHDPVAYITGAMTKLSPRELISFQIILSPTKSNETDKISRMILRNEDVLGYLNRIRLPAFLKPIGFVFKLAGKIIQAVGNQVQWALMELTRDTSRRSVYAHNQYLYQTQPLPNPAKPARVLSSFEEEAIKSVQGKINQSLFETTIRVMIVGESKTDQKERVRGFVSSLATFSVPKYQSFKKNYDLPFGITNILRSFSFRKRLLSLFDNSSSLLSISEVSDLYHFPFMRVTQTENIVKIYSRELPAPLSLKNNRSLAVVFGENTYGGTHTPIGLTKEERETHQYIVGRTGSGKTTLMFSMAKHDIEKGSGMAFIDPHGDISEDLLAITPEERKNEFIYLNPIDLKHPIGINLLELTPGLDEDEAELEKEVVCEGVISLFRKVFSKEENANAHRIEYILRNTIYTAFTVESPTIFTLYELLNNPPFQKEVIKHLTDENLKNFWKFEFGRAGNYQVVKMVGGVTAKVGRFLFSPTAKRILEQKKSTINFDEIMNQGKILLCNFSQGNLGEDTARLLGTTVLTKLQQAALRRARLPKDKRKPFYLYIDEFQNFATHAFIKMLSEGRKYGLSVCIAEQSTSQQDDKNIVNTILANVTTVICFRSANPIDAQLMLTQFEPYIEKSDIINLPRYKFYIKISAIEPEEPFSGATIYTPITKDLEKIQRLLDASRKNYAIKYKRIDPVQPKITINTETTVEEESAKRTEKVTIASGLPKKSKKVETAPTSGDKK